MNTKDAVSLLAAIVCLALVPGSFVAAFYLIRKPVKDPAARVILTIILGIIIFVSGAFATIAGCSTVAPMDFR